MSIKVNRFLVACFMSATLLQAQQKFGQGPLTIKIIHGDSEKIVVFTREEIKNFKPVSARARSMAGAQMATWIGTPFRVMLAHAGVDLEAVRKVVVSSPDGYVSVLEGRRIAAVDQAICSYKIAETPDFPEALGGLRLVFPDQRGMYWVNSPHKVVIHSGPEPAQPRAFVLRSLQSPTVARLMQPGDNGQYIRLSDLRKALSPQAASFRVMTLDSLNREYDCGTLLEKMKLAQWEDGTWSIGGEDVPVGLKTLDIFYIQFEGSGLILKELLPRTASFWEETLLPALLPADLPREECAITMVKQDGYTHPSMKQRHWIGGDWNLARLVHAEYSENKGLDHLKLSW